MNQQLTTSSGLLSHLKTGVWILCIPACVFGVIERSINAWSHRSLSALDLAQIFTAVSLLLCWLLLKPSAHLKTQGAEH